MIAGLYLRIAIYAAIAAAGFAAGWQAQGWRHDADELARMEAEQASIQQAATRARELVNQRDARLQLAAELDAERQRNARVVERVITNDVIKYVQTTGAAKCGLDANGVRIVNTAAAGRVSENTNTAAASDAGAGTVTAAAIVASVTDNYRICTETAVQLRALQDWVRALYN